MALSIFDLASASTLVPIKAALLDAGGIRISFRSMADRANFESLIAETFRAMAGTPTPFAVYWRGGELFIASAGAPLAITALGRPRTIATCVLTVAFDDDGLPEFVNNGLPDELFAEILSLAQDALTQPDVIDAEFKELPILFDAAKEWGEEEEEAETVPAEPAEPELSEEQQAALATIIEQSRVSGSFTFVTGKAGTGKSTILRAARKVLNPIVLAPTGLAACNVGGQTIHSFFGFRPGPMSGGRARGLSNWKLGILTARPVIFIDEFGMVRADIVDGIDKTLRRTPGLDDKKPFGGIPVVAFGDPFQLEPVVQSGADADFMKEHYKSPFFFDADVMREAHVENVALSQVFRQTGDDEFVDALNGIRKGDPEALEFFNDNFVSVTPRSEEAVRICFKNATAKSINFMELSCLEGEAYMNQAVITGEMKENEHPTEASLRLKVGAQVMVCKNIQTAIGNLANGQVGVVTRFEKGAVYVDPDSGATVRTDIVWVEVAGNEYPVTPVTWEQIQYTYNPDTKDVNEDACSTFRQFPLKLAWAITAHKSQGQTLPAAHIAMDCPAFSHGQLYVALSRVKGRDGFSIGRKLTRRDLIVNPAVQGYDLFN